MIVWGEVVRVYYWTVYFDEAHICAIKRSTNACCGMFGTLGVVFVRWMFNANLYIYLYKQYLVNRT